MARFCTKCGKELSESAMFCVGCGAKVANIAPKKNFCEYCGTEYKDGMAFCAACGADIKSTPIPPRQVPQPQRMAPQAQPRTAPQAPSRAVPARPATTAKAPRKKKWLVPVTAVVLVFATVMSLFVWPGFLKQGTAADEISPFSSIALKKSDYNVKPTVVNVGPDDYTVAADGVTVDFGEYNDLSKDRKLEIKDIGEKWDETESVSAHIYDFKLEDQSEFFFPVAVTLPCRGIDDPFVQYYNEDAKNWEYVPSAIGEDGKSVVFLTDHFSSFGVFEGTKGRTAKSIFIYEDLADTPKTPVSKVYYNPAYTREIIDKCNADTKNLINSLKSDPAQNKKFTKYMLDSIGSASTAIGGTDYTSKVVTFLNSIEIPKGLDDTLSYAGAAFTSVKVGLSWYESGSISKALEDNAFDLAELALSSAAGAYGSAPLSVCAGAALLAGVTNEVGKEATKWINGGYETPAEHAYGDFAEKHLGYSFSANKFTPVDLDRIATAETVLINAPRDAVLVSEEPSRVWGDVFRKAYLENKGDPKKTMAAIDAKINEYAIVFWGLDGNLRKLVAEDIHRAHAWKEPDHDIKVKMRDGMVMALKSRMNLLYKGLFEKFMLKAQKDCEKQMQSVTKQLNKIIKVSIVAEDEDGKEYPISRSEYKDYIAAFIDPETGEPMENWQWNPSKGDFEFTIFNYGALGTPKTVKLYESRSKLNSGESDVSLFFTFKKDEDKIVLKVKTTEEKPNNTDKPNVPKGEGYWRLSRVVEDPERAKEYVGTYYTDTISGGDGSYTAKTTIHGDRGCLNGCHSGSCKGEFATTELSYSTPKSSYRGGETVTMSLRAKIGACTQNYCSGYGNHIYATIRPNEPDYIFAYQSNTRTMEDANGESSADAVLRDGRGGMYEEHSTATSRNTDLTVSGTMPEGGQEGDYVYIVVSIAPGSTASAQVAYEYVWTINK